MINTNLIRSFGILNRTFHNFISKSILDKDISFSDSFFLINIGEKEGITQEEISNSLAIDKAAIARSVKSMEGKGYLRIVKSESDKRSKKLYLTDSGKSMYNFIQGLNKQWVDYIMENLDIDDVENFIQTIDGLSERAKNI